MKSALRGKNTLDVEVTNVSKHGFWILAQGRELFLPFAEFPWFADVAIGQLVNVEFLHADHLYWPDLDIDLSLECIAHPENFPLVSCVGPNRRIQPARKRRARG
jgi:hypothetical protein